MHLSSISICYFQKGHTDMGVYRADVTFLIPIGEMDFFSLVLIFCAVLLVTVLFLFQKAATNNTLISKECDFMLWNEWMHNNRNIRETVIIPQNIIVPTKSIIVASLGAAALFWPISVTW